jgi:hypothetical protein
VNALVKYKGLTETEAGDFLEGLKEEERYVLEVRVIGIQSNLHTLTSDCVGILKTVEGSIYVKM